MSFPVFDDTFYVDNLLAEDEKTSYGKAHKREVNYKPQPKTQLPTDLWKYKILPMVQGNCETYTNKGEKCDRPWQFKIGEGDGCKKYCVEHCDKWVERLKEPSYYELEYKDERYKAETVYQFDIRMKDEDVKRLGFQDIMYLESEDSFFANLKSVWYKTVIVSFIILSNNNNIYVFIGKLFAGIMPVLSLRTTYTLNVQTKPVSSAQFCEILKNNEILCIFKGLIIDSLVNQVDTLFTDVPIIGDKMIVSHLRYFFNAHKAGHFNSYNKIKIINTKNNKESTGWKKGLKLLYLNKNYNGKLIFHGHNIIRMNYPNPFKFQNLLEEENSINPIEVIN